MLFYCNTDNELAYSIIQKEVIKQKNFFANENYAIFKVIFYKIRFTRAISSHNISLFL